MTRTEQASAYRLIRVFISLALMTVGSSGMFAAIIILHPLTSEYGIDRADASLPYMMFMLGFGLGGIVMGHISDRIGILIPVIASAFCLSGSLYWAAHSDNVWLIAATAGFLAGFLGSATTFGPLVADISHWFLRRRGLAVGIVISGNYLSGTIWPPVLQYFIDQQGWRDTFIDLSLFVLITMLPLTAFLYRKSPQSEDEVPTSETAPTRPLISYFQLQCLLCVAGVGCCAAMAMPQVHIVPYASDLGFTAAHGAVMMSLMLGFGIVSRLVSGWISDRIGGLKTLLLGSFLQTVVIALFLTNQSLVGLYILSALFGLSQGGIVPAYTIIVRTYFPAKQAGWRIGFTLSFTMLGMALGGWMAGALYDLTGSYTLAFVNAIAWNLLNMAIAAGLLYGMNRQRAAAY